MVMSWLNRGGGSLYVDVRGFRRYSWADIDISRLYFAMKRKAADSLATLPTMDRAVQSRSCWCES